VLGYLNRVHGTTYELSSWLGGTEPSMTYLLNGPDGSHAVLRWNRDPGPAQQLRRAAPLIAAARAAGWPTPAWLVSGTTPSGFPYHVLEHAPGTPGSQVTTDLVRAILPVLQTQAGLAPAAGPDWTAHDHQVVFGADPADADAVAAFCPAGAALVADICAWTGSFRSVTLPAGDLVHGHLVPDNVLLDNCRVTALTGAEALGKGSRMHDVASLAVHGLLWDGEPGALDELLSYAAAHAGPGEFEVSLAAGLLAVVAHYITDDADHASGLIDQAAAALARLRRSGVRPAVAR
jgi:aminoglycoside phosphotransferase (APT) family kinase protein